MARFALVAAGLLCLLPAAPAQETSPHDSGFAERSEQPGDLIDEDEDFAPKQSSYAFNPVQARKELKVGNYYAKKGSHRAAAGRYEEATRWDTNFAEAYMRLGMALEELDRDDKAIEAYTRFLRIEPDGKQARSVRRSLERLRQPAERPPPAAEEGEPKK